MIHINSTLKGIYEKSRNSVTSAIPHVGLLLAQNVSEHSEKAKIYSFLSTIEKSISAYRRKNENEGTFYFNRLKNRKYKFHRDIQSGIEAIANAVEGYKEYILMNYDYSESLMYSAIKNSIEQSIKYPLFIISAFEQWINLIRLLIASENFEKLEGQITAYFLFLVEHPIENHLLFNTQVIEIKNKINNGLFIQQNFYILDIIRQKLESCNRGFIIESSNESILKENLLFYDFVKIISGKKELCDFNNLLNNYSLFPNNAKFYIDDFFK